MADEIHLRPATAGDLPFLATMLGEAAVWRPDRPTPTGPEVLADPRFSMYLVGWPRAGDLGLVAEGDRPVGATWYRHFPADAPAYGYVGDDVPELAIAVDADHRGRGIGRRLLRALVAGGRTNGVARISLSVNHDNPARALYRAEGFVPVSRHGDSWTMVTDCA